LTGVDVLQRIRVLLANLPRMLRDVFRLLIVEQSDMEVVGELGNGVELLLATGQTQPDIIILGVEGSELPGIGSHLLNEFPHVKLLGVTADGQHLTIYELRPHAGLIGNVSPQGLLDAIRKSVRI
jgi:DNA-binding NarL/FixJ family response regulator